VFVEDLADGEGDIPRYALETIAEVHARCPGAKFFIEVLTKRPDPFLVAALDETSVTIWKSGKSHVTISSASPKATCSFESWGPFTIGVVVSFFAVSGNFTLLCFPTR
jgi:hypothetical protein